MEETRKKDQRNAMLGTLIFHAVLVVFLLLFGLSTPLPLPEEEGVLVTLGYLNEGMGDLQPLSASPATPASQPSVPSSQAEEVVTQQTEESIRLPDETPSRRPAEPQPESPRREPTPEPVQSAPETPPEPPRPQVDQRALFPGADQRTTERQDQGQTDTQGNQGRPEGAVDGAGFEGVGQGGVEFNLTGRRANFLPIPEYTTRAQGRVVVSIIVNRQGQVVRVSAGARGTTTSDQALWRLAEDAARRARFDVATNAPEEQTGTITYNFIRQN
jgi:colicin import membrane protein